MVTTKVDKNRDLKNSKKSSSYFYGLGRRKEAIARVYLKKGQGFLINNKPGGKKAETISLAPLNLVGKNSEYEVNVKVKGGGKVSQLEAIRLGLARALVKVDKELRPTLRKAGFLTRDPREKERKKAGLKRARRAPQWSKR